VPQAEDAVQRLSFFCGYKYAFLILKTRNLALISLTKGKKSGEKRVVGRVTRFFCYVTECNPLSEPDKNLPQKYTPREGSVSRTLITQ